MPSLWTSFSLSVKAFEGLGTTLILLVFFFQDSASQTGRRIRLAAEPRQFHFAMSGKSYQVVAQYFSHLLPKVRYRLFNWSRLANQ